MDLGFDKLREHLRPTYRAHRAITAGGIQPNIIPDFGQIWWFVRDANMTTAKDTFDKLVKIAEGAALMTGTTMEYRIDAAAWPLRRAFNLALDFEEMNKQFFYGAYKRIGSFFEGSELASSGLPTGLELEILETVRGQVPPEVFTTAYKNPTNGNPNAVRNNLREATRLLREAGYEIRNQKLINAKTGARLQLSGGARQACRQRGISCPQSRRW